MLFFSYAYSQQTKIDSLKNVLEKTETSAKRLEVLTGLTKLIANKFGYEKEQKYFRELLSLSKELNNKNGEGLFYEFLSEHYMRKSLSDSAIHYANKSLQTVLTDVNSYLPAVNQLGRVYHHFEQYEKAIKTYYKGLNKFENEKDTVGVTGQIYMNMSSSYKQLGNTQKATEYLLKGVQVFNELKNFNQTSYGLYALGYAYMNEGNYEKAEKYLLKNIRYADSLQLSDFYTNINHHALGINYSRWKKYKKAEIHNLKALDYYTKENNKLYVFDVLNNLAALHTRTKNYKTAEKYGLQSLKTAKDIQHSLAINGAYQTLLAIYLRNNQYNKAEKYLLKVAKDTANSKTMSLKSVISYYKNSAIIAEKKGNFKKSLKEYKRFSYLQDSLNKIQKESKFAKLETQYQTEKKEKENLQLKAEKAEQQQQLKKENQQKWLYGIGFLLSVLALTIFGYYYRKNQQQKQLIESLQKELHHRVKNNLSIIDRFVEVLKEEFNEPKFTSKLNQLQNRIGSINEVHQQLYHNKNVTQLNMKSYINQLANNVQESFPNNTININQQIDKNLALTSTKSFPLGIIINEFLTNSYKYAFENNKGSISIKMKEAEQGYTLFLSDKGKGLPEDFDIKKDANFGLRIISLLCQQINANFNLKNNKGVQLTIQIPK